LVKLFMSQSTSMQSERYATVSEKVSL